MWGLYFLKLYPDALNNLLLFNGNKVIKEYYINDYVKQIESFVKSVFLRLREIKYKEKFVIKEDLYPGDYIKEIAKDIMRILADRDLAQRIAVEATEIFNGKDANFTEITGMIEKHKQNISEEKTPAVTSDVEQVLDLLDVTTKWKFNIPVLKENVGGIGGGNLMIAFARPETGKTAFGLVYVQDLKDLLNKVQRYTHL